MPELSEFGRNLREQASPTFKIFGDLLRNPHAAKAIRRKVPEVHSYGTHARHLLDLYPGASSTPNSVETRKPILVFIYGGGFVTGSRRLPFIEGDLVYQNVGYFFSEKLGFDTIIMDYTLIKDGARFPKGAEEIDMVLQWLENSYLKGSNGRRDLYLVGNSAGGVNLATWFFMEAFSASARRLTTGSGRLRLKAVLILSSPFLWDPQGGMRDVLLQYYAGEAEMIENSPITLMRKAKLDSWQRPALIMAVSEFDPKDIVDTSKEFLREWNQRGQDSELWVLPGHNHFSPPLALGTTDIKAEAWGYELMARLQAIP